MERTGIAPEGDPAGCRWVAVRHADEHVHLVATLAREDGRPPRVWNDYRALAEVAHTFEAKLGLRSTAEAMPSLSRSTEHLLAAAEDPLGVAVAAVHLLIPKFNGRGSASMSGSFPPPVRSVSW